MPQRSSKKSMAEIIGPIYERYKKILPRLKEIEPTTFFQGNYWTTLKLVCLATYIHACYVPIISKNKTMQKNIGDRFYFIDLLSNSGVNLLCNHVECEPEPEKCKTCKQDRKNYFVGSSILASTAEPPFKTLYFVDKNKDNLDCLEKRLLFMKQQGLCKSDIITKHEDCNVVVDEILSEIKSHGSFHFLAFVDNEGLDADWVTVEKLLDAYFSDLVINFPTSSVKRNMHYPDTVCKFLGLDNIGLLNGQPALDYYVDKIRKKGRTVETIPVNTGKGYHYDIIIVTKKDAKFMDVIYDIKTKIKSNSAKEAETAFTILNGKQKTLDKY